MKLRALDLFCGAGGATKGLQQAGFHVSGVDINPQPNYCGDLFLVLDAMNVSMFCNYDFIWASPPCQAFTAYKRRPGHVAPVDNLIPRVRAMLAGLGVPFVIENVPGAPLVGPFMLCGSMFGIDVRRHRIFEPHGFSVLPPLCNHALQQPRFAPATNRKNLRSTVEVGVWRIPLDVQQKAMGIDWMNREELSQAIPPAYSEFIGRKAARFLDKREGKNENNRIS